MQMLKTKTKEIQDILKELSENVVQKEWKRTKAFYHYTSLSKLFNILESDSFWASNIRFSNDETEVKLLNDDRHDDYVICFCENGGTHMHTWRSESNSFCLSTMGPRDQTQVVIGFAQQAHFPTEPSHWLCWIALVST